MEAAPSRRAVIKGAAGVAALTATGGATAVSAAVSAAPSTEPSLDGQQAGHLRHWHNLMRQLPGDWSHMQGDPVAQGSDEAAYQHQLAYMSYAAATAHYHRLPAAPGVFRADFDAGIQKMLRQDVWSYWEDLSRGNKRDNPALTGPREPVWNPVIKENIIYSGHLNAMVALYGYLFNDDKYDRMGSISFRPRMQDMWAKGLVEYNIQSLNDVIYWQMVENGFLGVACQPNRVFNVCNQFPILGFRFHDARKGTDVTTGLLAAHKRAWQAKGGYEIGKPTPFEWRPAQNEVLGELQGPGYFGVSAWYPEYFRSMYGAFKAQLYRNPDGTMIGYPPTQWPTLAAQRAGGAVPAYDRSGVAPEMFGFMGMMPGYEALNLSEAGDPDFAAFMRYVDLHRNPTWEKGGLYYPRNDTVYDAAGHMVAVAPHAGNATYFWARMNVAGGLNKLFQNLWGKEHFAEPQLADLDHNVDVTEARFSLAGNELRLTVQPPRGSDAVDARLVIANIARQGDGWTLRADGREIARGSGGELRTAARGVTLEGGALTVRMPVERTTSLRMQWA